MIGALPAVLQREAMLAWQHLQDACDDGQRQRYQALLDDADFARHLATLFAASSFAAQLCRRFPGWLPELAESGELARPRRPGEGEALLQRQLAARAEGGALTTEALDIALRRFRNREYLRIIWRDFNRLAGLAETTADITAVAELTLDAALDFHYRALCSEVGTPRGSDGQPQRLVVLGMGKLGACELNLSSDIDLIFAYPAAGETDGIDDSRRGSIPNQEFFTRLGQRLIRALDQNGAEGFVFRVDMRLRPWGESGALVLNFDAMEAYYQDQGRDWERYAMIKARPVAGDRDAGRALMERLRPFTFRRYIDFSAFESLRQMKLLIQREVQRRRLQQNIKLGAGGIREVEFIAQCFQLIRGGRDRVLQERNLQKVLEHLAEFDYLPADVVAELQAANHFLRNTEHAIQGYQDRQTQELPTSENARAALALVMGCADWPAFMAVLDHHRTRVTTHFNNVIAAPEDERRPTRHPDLAHWRGVWIDPEPSQAVVAQQLAEHGHEAPEEAARRLLALRSSQPVTRMQSQARARLDEFMPQLLGAVTAAQRPSQTLQRILPLVEAVLRRTAYLVLLVENPPALQELVVLCAASPWIADRLARHPALLDELLDARTLYQAPGREELLSDLKQQLLRIPLDDLEAQMEALRYFKLSHQLRVAAAEVTGRLPLMKVSDYLTWIAETILEHVLELAWHYLTSRHGAPRLSAPPAATHPPLPLAQSGTPISPLPLAGEGAGERVTGETADASSKHFIVVGYGKLGGIELSHGSDLDLVFIHDTDPALSTDGPTPLDNGTFYTRLGQRMIHILTSQTPLGALYEVDMRLRPSGNSGLLVATLKAFADYQHKSAWTWEHQALVRARPVAGDRALAEDFNRVRREVLCLPRDTEKLRREVLDMRQKMREQLKPRGREDDAGSVFDLKHGVGGIVDIEFMVQYAALMGSHDHPALSRWTDNIRIIESLRDEGIYDQLAANSLTESYKTLREALHRLNLQQLPGRTTSGFEQEREPVISLWRSIFIRDFDSSSHRERGA